MAMQSDIYCMGGTRIVLGVLGASTFPTKITAPAGTQNIYLQYVSGGSIEILPNAVSGQTMAGATAAGLGFLVGTSIPYLIPGPAAFFIACGSAVTAVLGIGFQFTAGGATLV